MSVRNFKMIVSYDGTRYYGWEHQPGSTGMTIQGKLESVLNQMLEEETESKNQHNPYVLRSDSGLRKERSVLRVQKSIAADKTGTSEGEKDVPEGKTGTSEGKGGSSAAGHPPVTVIGAGRTDAGVSARAQTCNVLLDTDRTEQEIQRYMNRYLPDDISVNEVKQAADRFHSRFKAIGKTYRYTLWYSEDGSKPVFDRKQVTVLKERPDLEQMKAAAAHLTGMHDYRSFCGNSHMKKSTIRVVDTINIETSGHYIRIYYHGNGFLQNMVRIMTGTLLECGYGRLSPEDMDAILEAKDRKKAGPTAPAAGLCLMKVDY